MNTNVKSDLIQVVSQLIHEAELKCGGTNALARKMGWNAGALAAVKAGTRALPAFRAAQMAELAGQDVFEWVFEALQLQSRTADEQAYWSRWIRRRALFERVTPTAAAENPVVLADQLLERGRLSSTDEADRTAFMTRRVLLRTSWGYLAPDYDWPGLPE